MTAFAFASAWPEAAIPLSARLHHPEVTSAE